MSEEYLPVPCAISGGKLEYRQGMKLLYNEDAGVHLGRDSREFAGFLWKWAGEVTDYIQQTDEMFLDVGCGSGILALMLKKAGVKRVIGIDRFRMCVEFSRINAAINDLDVGFFCTQDLALNREPDVVVSNPPFMYGESLRAWCNGGDHLGMKAARDIVCKYRQSSMFLYLAEPVPDRGGGVFSNFLDAIDRRYKKNLLRTQHLRWKHPTHVPLLLEGILKRDVCVFDIKKEGI